LASEPIPFQRARQADGAEPHVRRPHRLGHGIVDGEDRNLGGGHGPRRHVQEGLLQPVVEDFDALAIEHRIPDQTRPQPDRGVHQLTPDPLLVEVAKSDAHIERARRSVELPGAHTGRRAVPTKSAHVLLVHLRIHRLAALERSAIDMDHLGPLVDVLGPWHPLRQGWWHSLGPKVRRLQGVGISRVSPQFHARLLDPRSLAFCHSRLLRARIKRLLDSDPIGKKAGG
jgi:hypothetical protein